MSSLSVGARVTRVLVVLAIFVWATDAGAQIFRQNGRMFVAPHATESQQLFVVDREMTQRLERARDLIDQEQFSPALTLLQSILDRPEDLYVEGARVNQEPAAKTESVSSEGIGAKQAAYRSLKAAAEQQIARLPREGRRVYEHEYGFTARQLFDESRRTGDVGRLNEIVRRFLHTDAGPEAAHRLAMYHLDRGEYLTAARLFERLQQLDPSRMRREPRLALTAALCWIRGGLPERAQEVLAVLEERAAAGGKLAVGGREVSLAGAGDDVLAWMETTLGTEARTSGSTEAQWTVFRGNAARNGSTSPANPLWEEAWTCDALSGPEADGTERFQEASTVLRRMLDATEGEAGEALMVPAFQPLVLGDTVVFRTFSNVRAVHLQTGETRWESARIDPSFEMMMIDEGDGPMAANSAGRLGQSLRETFTIQRAWRDLTNGLLSSDGRYLYCVEDLGFFGATHSVRGMLQPLAPRDHNKLTAVELETGRLKWEMGGERTTTAGDLSGAFFLGPPLAIEGQLYCLTEENGEIRLVAIEVDQTNPERPQPKMVWSQRLVYPESKLQESSVRRVAGLSPSFSDGVMVCPTAAGAVVGVDLVRRTLLWGYRYPTVGASQNGNVMIWARANGRIAQLAMEEERWIDDAPVIESGHVLLTPLDSGEFHCLSLVDGSLKWKQPRGHGLYIAGVYDGRVIVVGRTQVQAIRLADGKPAWDAPTPIPAPSGRGVPAGRFYHLPLSTGEIATIDLTNGRLLARSVSPDASAAGNLVASAGRIVSQSADRLVAFRALDEVEEEIRMALQKQPDDAVALARRGELRLHRGEEAEGVADLRRAVELGSGETTRELLTATLLEGLRLDFLKYRDHADELADLITEPAQRARYRRLYAAGLQKSGDITAAFDQYLELASDVDRSELEDLDGGLSVRSDRWLAARLSGLYDDADAQQREQMDSAIQQELDEALADESPERLRSFLASFSGSGQAEPARRALVERLDAKADSLELEQQLVELRSAPDESTAGWATAQLVSLLLQIHRPREAAGLMAQLGERWGDVVCLDGKTGRQLVEDWREDKEVAESLASARKWDEQPFDAKRSDTPQNRLEQLHEIEILGQSSPYFEGWRFCVEQRSQNITAIDGSGAERWEFPIHQLGRSVQSQYGLYARMDEHLVVVALGNFFGVFDALTPSGKPRLLWKRDLLDPSSSEGINRGVQPQQMILPGGQRRIILGDSSGRQTGSVGPVSLRSVVYQVGTDLYSADALSGEVQWHRRGLPRGCELFGDGEHVFAVPPNSAQALVFRAADGEQVGTRAIPEEQHRKAMIDRFVLSWGPDGDDGVLSLTDALTGQVVWRKDFAIAAALEVIGGDEVAVLEPKGRFVLLRLRDGEPRIDEQLDEHPKLEQIVVRRSSERYVLLSRSSDQNQNNIRVQLPGTASPTVNGHVYAFDRTSGRRLWQARIDASTLDLRQPIELPVLVLVEQSFASLLQPGGAAQVRSPQYSVTILDARTGSTVYDRREERPPLAFEVRQDIDAPRIDVVFQQFKIELSSGERRSDDRDPPATGD